MENSDSQPRPAKLEEFGDAGLVVDFIDINENYTAESHDALVVIYRDRQGRISAIEIEFTENEDEESY